MHEDQPTLSDVDLDRLASRIAVWTAELPDAERPVVEALVLRAALPQDDAQGFGNRALSMLGGNLNAQGRLGNFEIQRLMSQFNQAETLASNVLKKHDDAAAAVISKI